MRQYQRSNDNGNSINNFDQDSGGQHFNSNRNTRGFNWSRYTPRPRFNRGSNGGFNNRNEGFSVKSGGNNFQFKGGSFKSPL